jgi:hypothetical protein
MYDWKEWMPSAAQVNLTNGRSLWLERACDNFLTCAALADDEDRNVRRRDLAQESLHSLHFCAKGGQEELAFKGLKHPSLDSIRC